MPVSLAYRPHPWHGLSPGDRFPEIITAYVEIVPSDGVEYEIDKHSGYLKVDRPEPSLRVHHARQRCALRSSP